MIFAMCFTDVKNAMGDSYKDIINNFKDKNHIVCMIPFGYSEDDFSNEFKYKYHEKVSNVIKNKFLKRLYMIINIIKFVFDFKIIKKKYRIDTIFIYPDNRFVYPILSLFLKNIKIICWIHDPSLHTGENKFGKINRFLNNIFLFKKVDRYIVSYEQGKKELKNNYNINMRKVYSIKLPRMSSMEFIDVRNNKDLKIKYDVIFFGRIEKYKGIDLLIDTISNYKELNKYKFLIVGTGKESKRIKAKVKTLNNIDFINNYVPNKKLAEYIMMSKFVILPYRDATGSQTIQIANYYNKLVLSTMVGCFPEYIIEGENGFFIRDFTEKEIKNGIIKILEYINHKRNISMRESLERFNIKYISSDLYKIITM